MKLNFVKLSPTQNMTVLVTSYVSRADQPKVAEKLMAYDSLHAEQVGFVEEARREGARARLQMMGGEFCGNASMSLAVLLSRVDGQRDGTRAEYVLEVSGAQENVHCTVQSMGESALGSASMPLPERIEEIELLESESLPVVRFPGIAHVLAHEDRISEDMAQLLAPKWCEQLHVDALGILLHDASFSKMRPLVYVRSTNSQVWERGCGSGSAAIGAYLAHRAKADVNLPITQPGGNMCVRAKYAQGAIQRIEIEGRVKVVAEGCAYVEE